MINFKKIIYDIVVTVACFALATAAPAAEEPCERDAEGRVTYDQRQNGTENYRLNVDGVVIAVAPVDSMLAALSTIDLEDLLDYQDISDKPTPDKPPAAPADKPEDPIQEKPSTESSKPDQPAEAEQPKPKHHKKALKLKLANILLPLLRKYRHH